jgi:hypothetical protein
MNIDGAKALKRRLGPHGTDDARPDPADVPEDAPPVYRWFGVTPENPPPDDEEPATSGTSLFRRLGLSFR